MNVADVQQHFAELARLLRAAGAAKASDELGAVQRCLEPFRSLTVKAFADFLARAEAYSRGEVPLTPSRARGPRAAGGTPAGTKADEPTLASAVRALYDQATSPSVTAEQVTELGSQLQGLSKDSLVRVAEGIDLKGMKSKSKGAIVQAIQQRILARKGSFQRAGLIDRPAGEDPASAAADTRIPAPTGVP